jgi:hypothetical protein
VGKTAKESFSALEEFLMNFFIFSRFRMQQSNSNPLPSIAQTRGCMYYKEDYKTIFQDDSNKDFIILSHRVQK